jgi:RNA polymerase sigma factor (TIGR02999 family)
MVKSVLVAYPTGMQRTDARPAPADDSAPPQELSAEVYRQLRVIARARLRRGGRETLLDTTALVHEAFLRIGGRVSGGLEAGTPQHAQFLAYASRAMRSIIVDLARKRQTERHGGDVVMITLTGTGVSSDKHHAAADHIVRVHEALEELARIDERLAHVVEMRYFGGLSEPEIAQALEVSERTVRRDWEKARLLLAQVLLD